jgi:signal peptidase I
MGLTKHINSRGLLVALLLAVAAFAVARRSLGTLSVVQGSSMYPTFRPDDVVQARELPAELQRGDIVIITDDRGDEVIKRILGLPGETVTIFRGFVYVNHQRIHEPYLPRKTYTFNSDENDERPFVWKLETGKFFVLGDNRSASMDSRHYGAIERKRIKRAVNLPANSVAPGFCEVTLSENRKVTSGKHGRPPG